MRRLTLGGHFAAAAALAAGGVLLCLAATARANPVLGQVNDFESGNAQGWTNGPGATDPVNNSTGGPAGANDNFLRVSARGGGGAGSRLISYNRAAQWTGNYVAAGVTGISMDVKNLGTTPLIMRIALQEQSTGVRFFSRNGQSLPADNAWHHMTFNLTATDLNSGTNLTRALGRVFEIRVLHSPSAQFQGAAISSSFGIDNVTAVPEPGLGAVLGMVASWVLTRRPNRTETRNA